MLACLLARRASIVMLIVSMLASPLLASSRPCCRQLAAAEGCSCCQGKVAAAPSCCQNRSHACCAARAARGAKQQATQTCGCRHGNPLPATLPGEGRPLERCETPFGTICSFVPTLTPPAAGVPHALAPGAAIGSWPDAQVVFCRWLI